MRNRGKTEAEEYNNYNYNNNEGIVENGYGENYQEFQCKKHPNSTTSGGICAYCLTDRLYQLVCPKCGDLSSSCSCTFTNDLYSSNHRNSTSSFDVGHGSRISFLLENDNKYNNNNNYSEVSSSKPRMDPRSSSASVDDFARLRRSNSTCVSDLNSMNFGNSNNNNNSNIGRKESKEKFWKIGKLFRKKKEKSNYNDHENINYNNTKNFIDQSSNNECKGVTRSRSLSSFGGYNNNDNFQNSSSNNARASSVSTSNNYYNMDSAKMSCFSEFEARFSNFDYNNNVYMSCDDPGYIDLKLNNNDTVSSGGYKVPDLASLKRSGLGMSSTKEFGCRGNNEHEMFRNGSCRRSVTERELRKCRKSYKVWKWFKRHNNDGDNNQENSSGHDYHDDHQQHYHGEF